MPTVREPEPVAAPGGLWWLRCVGCGGLFPGLPHEIACPACGETPASPVVSAERRSGVIVRLVRQLLAVLPNRRLWTDMVDEICCPWCGRWVKPRQFDVVAFECRHCATMGRPDTWAGW